MERGSITTSLFTRKRVAKEVLDGAGPLDISLTITILILNFPWTREAKITILASNETWFCYLYHHLSNTFKRNLIVMFNKV